MSHAESGARRAGPRPFHETGGPEYRRVLGEGRARTSAPGRPPSAPGSGRPSAAGPEGNKACEGVAGRTGPEVHRP
ncbi:hypothetical protein Scani_49410 [Streptomyces caniferus]|uniref:Uncharacterized protein n=1 Tax=Streptomyces caniferus TaxID=285557 RepID=A0A640SBC0_9ACTN|nr:hypothetical protein Scani_49410 [Streptomyces caniferus]